MSTENALLTILTEKIKSDRLMLPTLPEVAVRVRQVSELTSQKAEVRCKA